MTQSGTEFLVVNSAGTYIIYSLSGSIIFTATAANNAGTIKASSPFNGILRVVKLNDPSHQALLDQHAAVYPTGANVDYSFTDTQATLKFIWTVQGDADNLLMLTWPHHRYVPLRFSCGRRLNLPPSLKLQNPNYPATNALNYLTTKGWMYPIFGSTWILLYDLPSIDWNAPRNPDSSCTSQIIQGLEYEIGKLSPSAPSVPGDFYSWGNAIAAQARLA